MGDNAKKIEHVFTYHAPTGIQPAKYGALREKAKEFAHFIDNTCPECLDKDIAQRKVREAVMWANSAIANYTVK